MRTFVNVRDPETGELVAVPVIMGAAAGTPDEIAADWAQKLGASGDKIRRGVAAVRAAPGQLAVRQKAVWQANTSASADKWAQKVGAVSLQQWQDDMTSKGIDRIASGATAAQPKMSSFLASFLPFLDRAKAALPPRGNFEQNIARMTAMVRATHGFQQGR